SMAALYCPRQNGPSALCADFLRKVHCSAYPRHTSRRMRGEGNIETGLALLDKAMGSEAKPR
ncbi:hypothetical protein, partial [Paludibacterium sp.]|uniref:hypothetical protein n=1 Tax=Paludibacterium sp. TaxID=1917523 RepID=UPI0025CBCD54